MQVDWFDSEVIVDAATAATIAEGMRRVAKADGLVHKREMNLIAAFEAQVPSDEAALVVALASDDLKQVFLRSLIMVALADGVISDVEMVVIRELAAVQSMQVGDIEEEVLWVKRKFLSVFAGVRVFRDSVLRVAADLGLPEAEVDALRQEA